MSLLNSNLATYQKGDKVAHGQLNDTNDAIRFLQKFLGDNLRPGGAGQNLLDQLRAIGSASAPLIRLGTIASNGPSAGDSDYKDARYWINISSVLPKLETADLIDTNTTEEIPTSAATTETATNLFELPLDDPGNTYGNGKGTHLLSSGRRVVLIGFPSQFDPTLVHWVFGHPAGPSVVVILGFSASDPSGAYLTSKIETGAATGFPLAGMSDGPDCFVFNGCEKNLTQPAGAGFVHLLDTTQPYQGTICGVDASTGKLIVLINIPPPLDVTLSTDGGTNGSVTGTTLTPQSYTYTVTGNGQTIMTAVQSSWNRPLTILTGPATKGRIYFDGAAMKLGPTEEMPSFGGCG